MYKRQLNFSYLDVIFSGFFTVYPSVHGADFFNRKSYGPVRCGFKKAEILRCGSVRFSDVNPTVRFDAVIYPTVRFGAVLKNRNSYRAVPCFHVSYGAIRCGFQKSGILRCGSVRFSDMVNLTVRFGAVTNPTVRFGAVPR